ncbi:acyl-CoA thioesterase II [Frondihabitans sp. PAMC 28766]|uniref:acyl-CoA thioesterase n=1 Tax=Frondihabitans sp. PAMC 28766 TaxID=1795630 RepID=UPI00078E4868|nr:acyl-CoA thioesterase II [Frondihabitans sp. PAMC 28766]AMM20387.1 acyl-CoA thioesterase II [Frondihabitans sp. PAMC 28766]
MNDATAHSAAPDEPLADLLGALTLTPGALADEFAAPSQWMPNGRVFGGQVLAQSLLAAATTVPSEKAVHSMHAYFLRAGKIEQPIEFHVDRSHDGRSFASRRTEALQGGVPIMTTMSSFQTIDEGIDHETEMPDGLADPESLPTMADTLAGISHPAAQFWAHGRPFDIRHIPSSLFLRVEGEHVAHQALWMKTVGRLPDDPLIHQAALLYASDLGILEPILRRHGVELSRPGMKIASLDHAMWWHRAGRADEWLLYAMESPTAQGGRGLATGRFFDRSGRLLASVAQEGMVRLPRSE